jgi:hypothetical protein
MALRKLRDIVLDGQRAGSRRLEANVLEDDTVDQDITDAATVIIGSELSLSKRKRLTDDLLISIRKMSESGGTIVATVVALQ